MLLRSAPAAYIAPVIGECPIELIEALDSPIKVAGLQGWLRHAGPDGTILPKQDFRAEDMPDGLTALVFSDEDHPDADALALELTKRVRYVVLTRGAHGLSLLSHGRRLDMPALDVPVVDPTGAGDTLGVVLTSSLLGGLEIEAALKRAIKAASLVIQGPELGRLDPKNLGPLNQAA